MFQSHHYHMGKSAGRLSSKNRHDPRALKLPVELNAFEGFGGVKRLTVPVALSCSRELAMMC